MVYLFTPDIDVFDFFESRQLRGRARYCEIDNKDAPFKVTVERRKKVGDFPGCDVVFFSERAKEILSRQFGEEMEFLPLILPEDYREKHGDYWVMLASRRVEGDPVGFPPPEELPAGTTLISNQRVIKSSDLEGANICNVDGLTIVSEEFKSAVEENKLKGGRFLPALRS